jgi:hypothetical protein
MTTWSVTFTFDADTEDEALAIVGRWEVTPDVKMYGLQGTTNVVPRPVEVTLSPGPRGNGLVPLEGPIAHVIENPDWPVPLPPGGITPAPGGPPAVNPEYDEPDRG